MEREKYQINLLIFHLQTLINNYNGIESLQTTNILMSPPLPNANYDVVPKLKLGKKLPLPLLRPNANSSVLPTGVTTPSSRFSVPRPIITDPTNITTAQKTPNVLSVSPSINAKNGNFSTPVMSDSKRKRKETEATDATSIEKKSRGRPPSVKIPIQGQNTLPQSKQIVSQASSATQSLAGNIVPSGPQVQGSSVVISLPVSKKPTRTTSCQNDADLSDIEFYRVPACNGEAASNLTNRVIVSPPEQMDYTKSSNCISSDKADSDKGSERDYDASDMLDSLDIPELANLTFDDDNDDLGAKFLLFDDNDMEVEISFNDDDLRIIFDDVLNDDQDLPCKGVNFSEHPTSDQSKDNGSRVSPECEGEQVISELLPSTVAKVLSEKDMNIQGPNSLTAMGSFKKCTTNLSSRRNRHHGFDKENF